VNKDVCIRPTIGEVIYFFCVDISSVYYTEAVSLQLMRRIVVLCVVQQMYVVGLYAWTPAPQHLNTAATSPAR